MRSVRRMMHENTFSPYTVRRLTEDDIPSILKLYESNIEYFRYCPPNPTWASVQEDMLALPPAKTMADKHFIGFFERDALIAVMDLIDRYPDAQTAFIGLFMVDKNRQGRGVGAHIVRRLSDVLRTEGCRRIRLGIIQDNLPARRFWQRLDFQLTGVEFEREHSAVLEAEKML